MKYDDVQRNYDIKNKPKRYQQKIIIGNKNHCTQINNIATRNVIKGLNAQINYENVKQT
jgi:hypothetical protein